jgi:hypothetical protein
VDGQLNPKQHSYKIYNMTYEIQMQFIPGNDSIWVARLTPEDPIYQYDNEAEAQAKADELQANDPTGRQYRITQQLIAE